MDDDRVWGLAHFSSSSSLEQDLAALSSAVSRTSEVPFQSKGPPGVLKGRPKPGAIRQLGRYYRFGRTSSNGYFRRSKHGESKWALLSLWPARLFDSSIRHGIT